MKTSKYLFLLLLLADLLITPFLYAGELIKVSGSITGGGKALVDVPVTDGVNIVYTNKQGRYSIQTSLDTKYIYYTLPSGYDSPTKDGLPVFYASPDLSKKNPQVNFDLIPSVKSQKKHAFIVVSDPQVSGIEDVGQFGEVVDDMATTISSLEKDMPVHVISAGDNVFDRMHLFGSYKDAIKTLGTPVYQTIGNHDMNHNERSNELSSDSFASEFGPTHYSFNVGEAHYVVLKNVFYYGFSYRYIGYLDETQLTWLEQNLKTVKPGSTLFLTMHIPVVYGETEKPYSYDFRLSNELMNRKALFEILKPYNVHILAGHSHKQWNTEIIPNLTEHVHAAACGAWWQGDLCTDGSPKSYTVYTVDGDDVKWYFKGVGQDKSEQFRLYPTGTDIALSECFIANVFNYDDQWQIRWYEDGVYKGEMSRYWGVDPLAASMYVPGSNKKYSWLGASETQHLFKARPEKQESKIEVEAIDRFGNTYKKETNNTIVEKMTKTGDWKLVWNDEFDYAGLPDASKWNFATYGNDWGWGNNELQHYTDSDSANAWVEDGILHIKALKKQHANKEFTSARLTTQNKGDWTYGRFEIRAKLPTGRGLWPAIWMMPSKSEYGEWPESGEIDIMENVGYNPDTIFATAHTKTYNHIINTEKTKGIFFPDSYKDFHVYTLEWDADKYSVYVDDRHIFTFNNERTGHKEWPFDKDFHLILNLAVGGNWGGQHGVDHSIFPKELLVDYVRVYQRVDF